MKEVEVKSVRCLTIRKEKERIQNARRRERLISEMSGESIKTGHARGKISYKRPVEARTRPPAQAEQQSRVTREACSRLAGCPVPR